MYKAYLNSELGWIELIGSEKGISKLEFVSRECETNKDLPLSMIECLNQLEEYFAGKRKSFSVKLNWEGTEFQQRVWEGLLTIPYGRTTSYLQMAKDLGDPNAVRAVGTANGKNDIAIIVPCHRVIGSGGSLTGYAYGVWRKEWLLKHEVEYSGAEKQLEMFE